MSEGQQAPGWYPVEGGQRYWDGGTWTEHFQASAPQPLPPPTAPESSSRFRSAIEGAVDRVRAGHGADDVAATAENAVWQASGKPITGIGGGRYMLTEQLLFFEKGTLRTDRQQVPVASILDVDMSQSMAQKARGVGTVLVHVQRSSGVEVVPMEDIPNPRDAQRIVNETAVAARRVLQQSQNTMRYEGVHPSSAPLAAPAAAPSTVDPMVQLKQLGELRDAGILTEEEFTAKKAEILSRL